MTINTHPICSVCGVKILDVAAVCDKCETPHHEECFRYAGKCSVFACESTRATNRSLAVASATEVVINDMAPVNTVTMITDAHGRKHLYDFDCCKQTPPRCYYWNPLRDKRPRRATMQGSILVMEPYEPKPVAYKPMDYPPLTESHTAIVTKRNEPDSVAAHFMKKTWDGRPRYPSPNELAEDLAKITAEDKWDEIFPDAPNFPQHTPSGMTTTNWIVTMLFIACMFLGAFYFALEHSTAHDKFVSEMRTRGYTQVEAETAYQYRNVENP